MTEYIGLAIVGFSLVFAISAAVMAWRLKQRLDEANSGVLIEKQRRQDRIKTYQDVLSRLNSAVASVSKKKDYSFESLFNELSPQLHLYASDEVNSHFVEVCLLLENWTAMQEDAAKTEAQLKAEPDKDLILSRKLAGQKKQVKDSYQLFRNKFNHLVALMRKEMSETL